MTYLFQDAPANQAVGGAAGESASVVRILLTLRFWSVLLFRLSQSLGAKNPTLGGVVKQLNQFVTGADLAWTAKVGPGLVLFHPSGVVIGPTVTLGADARVQQGATIGGLGGDLESHGPTIAERLTLGAGGRIIGPIAIGADVTVGANAVVVKDVPPNSVAVGVPAQVHERALRTRDEP